MKSFNRLVRLLSRDESGAVLILVALLIVVLMGTAALAVDGGSLYQARRQMVNAADAAALAGAQELIRTEGNKSAATAVAEDYAIRLNNSDVDKVTVSFPNDYTIVVEVGKQVDFGFARIFGIDNFDVPARAVAIIGTTTAVGGIIPIALPQSGFVNFAEKEEHNIINFEFELGSGNWNWVSFEGTGSEFNPHTTAEYISNGYPGTLSIGDPVQTNTGSAMPKFLEDAIQYHIDNETDLFMPIVGDENIGSGTSEYLIVGFAAIRFTDLYKDHAEHEGNQGMTWYLRAMLLDPEIYPGPLSTTIPDYGLHSLMLISENDID